MSGSIPQARKICRDGVPDVLSWQKYRLNSSVNWMVLADTLLAYRFSRRCSICSLVNGFLWSPWHSGLVLSIVLTFRHSIPQNPPVCCPLVGVPPLKHYPLRGASKIPVSILQGIVYTSAYYKIKMTPKPYSKV